MAQDYTPQDTKAGIRYRQRFCCATLHINIHQTSPMKKAIFYVYSLLLCCELLLSLGDPPTNDGWHGLVSTMVGSILAMPWTLLAFPVMHLFTSVIGKKTDTLYFILIWIGILANWIMLFRFSHKK